MYIYTYITILHYTTLYTIPLLYQSVDSIIILSSYPTWDPCPRYGNWSSVRTPGSEVPRFSLLGKSPGNGGLELGKLATLEGSAGYLMESIDWWIYYDISI